MKKYILTTIRIVLGGVLVLYAYAKFSGHQFIKLELNGSANEIEPALLVFYFFGYSQPYAMFCPAAVELITGLMIAIPKTTRIGVLIYFPFTLNIAVMDWCFDFPLSTRILISSLALLSFLLIIIDRKAYLTVLTNSQRAPT